MSVADSISGALLRFGRQMTLQRLTQGTLQVPVSVTVYGVTKNYEPHELIGGIIQGDTKVTFTTAEIVAASWPAPPHNGDRMIIDGKPRAVMSVESKYLGVDILVYVCQVRG